jgi:hypothetical protein
VRLEVVMVDLVFLGIAIVFFAGTAGLVRLLDRKE